MALVLIMGAGDKIFLGAPTEKGTNCHNGVLANQKVGACPPAPCSAGPVWVMFATNECLLIRTIRGINTGLTFICFKTKIQTQLFSSTFKVTLPIGYMAKIVNTCSFTLPWDPTLGNKCFENDINVIDNDFIAFHFMLLNLPKYYLLDKMVDDNRIWWHQQLTESLRYLTEFHSLTFKDLNTK